MTSQHKNNSANTAAIGANDTSNGTFVSEIVLLAVFVLSVKVALIFSSSVSPFFCFSELFTS